MPAEIPTKRILKLPGKSTRNVCLITYSQGTYTASYRFATEFVKMYTTTDV